MSAITHCPQGHRYDEVNTYLDPNNRRQCRTCRRDRKRAKRHRAAVEQYLTGWAEAIDGDYALVPLARSAAPAIIEVEDVPLVSAHAWHLHTSGYASTEQRTSGGRRRIYMHRLILGAEAGQEVDHADRDRLNNRRANLRIATRVQQSANQSIRSNNTSGYRGVSRTRAGRWGAWIRIDGRSTNLGQFDTPELAAEAYDAAALAAFGNFASLNFASLNFAEVAS